MTKLIDLFSKRNRLYQQRILKYSRIVFSDTFLIGFMVLFGALAYVYSEYVKGIQSGDIVTPLIFIIIISIIVSSGKLKTHLEEADAIFILPKEADLFQLLKANQWKQTLNQVIAPGIVSLLAMPTFVASGFLLFWQWLFLFISIIILKYAYIKLLQSKYLQGPEDNFWIKRLTYTVISAGILAGFVFINPWLGLFLSCLLSAASHFLLGFKTGGLLDWEFAITSENSRKQAIYQFFNLFTDVPFVNNRPKRLKVLDKILKKWESKTPLEFYLKRLILRDTSYSGLIVRLTVIGGVVLFFVESLWMLLLVEFIFIYLISFQLLPLLKHASKNQVLKTAPKAFNQPKESMMRVLRPVIGLVSLVFLIIVSMHSLEVFIYSLILQGLFLLLIIPWMVGHFISKHKLSL